MRALLIVFILLSLLGCTNDKKPKKINNGGIIFTFDDQYVTDWVNFRDMFNLYDIKATFFISRPQLLDSTEIAGLKTLQNDGHEIGCHSANHLNALDFEDSIDAYINSEVLPALNILEEHGFEITSFAFPFGKSTPEIDAAVSEYFTFVRKATYNYNDTTLDMYDEIFATNESHNIVNAMGIDMGYNITLENIESGIQRAKERNEVLILFGHKIIDESINSHITPEHLQDIFELCAEYEIKTMRIKDLEDNF